MSVRFTLRRAGPSHAPWRVTLCVDSGPRYYADFATWPNARWAISTAFAAGFFLGYPVAGARDELAPFHTQFHT